MSNSVLFGFVVLSGITLDALIRALADETLIREQRCDQQAAEAALHRRETLAYLADQDGRCVALGAGEDMVAQAAALRRLFAAYAGRAQIADPAPQREPHGRVEPRGRLVQDEQLGAIHQCHGDRQAPFETAREALNRDIGMRAQLEEVHQLGDPF